MERYYRILLLIVLVGIAFGIGGLILEQRAIALVGCLIMPPLAYVIAVLIAVFRR